MDKSIRNFFIVITVIIVFIASGFIAWRFLPKHVLDVVVVDKTVNISFSNGNYNDPVQYRKHSGLYWILRYNQYVKPSDKSYYDYKRDYYGPKAGINGTIINTNAEKLLNGIPDLIYLSDAYGSETIAKAQESGISEEEMANITNANSLGSTLIGEFNIEPSKKGSPVQTQLESVFGVEFSNWIGRYANDLADLEDVPRWTVINYESSSGKTWSFAGPGIILVSDNGEIVILQKGKDYTNSLNIKIVGDYAKKYGSLGVNYYGWFEIVKPKKGSETLAKFSIPLTKDGKIKLKNINVPESFPAILLKWGDNSAPTYYFAGDFNDYVVSGQYGDFIFADTYNRLIAYDKPGDNSNFFWNFYTPFMETVLKSVENNS